MLFHITYQYQPEHREPVTKRFLETGGFPPEGVKMIGRWHDVGELKGYLIAETNEALLIGKWLYEWTDYLTFRTSPVVTDEEAAEVIQSSSGK
jgi:hypothetical protein